MAGPNILWPDRHAILLGTLAAKGLSASHIACELNTELGTSYSRNAVIGKIKRLRVSWNSGNVFCGNRNMARRVSKPRVRSVSAPKAWTAPRIRPPKEVTEVACAAIVPKMIRCEDLGEANCRWPYDSGKHSPTFLFCGHDKPCQQSYCAPHEQMSVGLGTKSEREANRV